MRMLTLPRLALILTIGLAALGLYVLSAGAQETSIETVAVDANTNGNSPNALGETDVCSELAVGEEREIDIVIRGIPEVAGGSGGIDGFEVDFDYDERYLIVTSFDIEDQLLGQHEKSNVLDVFTDAVPSDTGLMKLAAADFGENAAESGNGVLARLTVRGVGAGTSNLRLAGVLVAGTNNFQYTIEAVQGGLLAVGESCLEHATPPPPGVTAQPSSPLGDDETPAPGDTKAADIDDGETPNGSSPTSNGDPPGGPSPTSNGETPDGNGSGDDDGNDWVLPVAIAAAVAAILAIAAAVFVLRRRETIS